MADVEERANNSPPPPKRRRVAEEDDNDDSPPSPPPPLPTNGSDLKKEDAPLTTDVKKPDHPASVDANKEKDVVPPALDTKERDTPVGKEKDHNDAKDDSEKEGATDKTDDIVPPYNGTLEVDENTRVPRHATLPAKDEYQPAPAPPPPAAPAPMGEYAYAPPPVHSASNHGNSQGDVHRMPSGLTPEVDGVLERIFQSGLFERNDIDGRALDFLGSVAPNLAMAALDDIQHRDFSTVRNKPAFIMSCFKRVVAAGGSSMPPAQPPPGGYPPTSVPASALAHLPRPVSDALQRVFHSGVCHPSQFDDRAMDILVDLHEADAVRALSEFAAMEPGRVRNPSAFWMGLARKYKGQGRRDGPGGPYGGGDGYGTYDRGNTGYGAVDQRIQELISHGQLPPNPLDDRALDALRRLPEQDALSVLAELPEPQRVRNMSAYVMGLCKKFASGEARSLASRGGGYPRYY